MQQHQGQREGEPMQHRRVVRPVRIRNLLAIGLGAGFDWILGGKQGRPAIGIVVGSSGGGRGPRTVAEKVGVESAGVQHHGAST